MKPGPNYEKNTLISAILMLAAILIYVFIRGIK